MGSLLRDSRWAVTTAAVVFLAAKAAYALALQGIVNVWFPSGVMLALLLVAERRTWVAILVGGFVGNVVADLSQGLDPALALGGPVANGVESLLAALVVRWVVGRRNPVASIRGVGALLVGAALLSNGVTALLGGGVLSAFYAAAFWRQWLIWLIGDGLGMLVVAPTILGLAHLARRTPRSRRLGLALETSGFAAVSAATAVVGFSRPGALDPLASVLVIPPLVVAGLRLKEGAHGVVLLTAGVVLWYSARGMGPLVAEDLTPIETSTQVLAFLGLVTCSVLVISAAVLEREAATEQREKLRDQLTHALEARVAARTRELQEANAELEAFSYSVSHDLKTPLRAIDGYSAFLEDALAAGRFEEAVPLVGEIRANARRMGRLIEDLLTLARVGRAQLVRHRVELAPLAAEIVERERKLAAERDIRLEMEEIPPVHGDAHLLRQALENVLGNAVKFTRPRAVAVIRIAARRDGDRVDVSVHDNGVGFPPEQGQTLFQVFHRLHPSEDFEGTGVGLAIVRRIVERHGGRVAAESVPDSETVIRFSLPAYADPRPDASGTGA
ncbi:MAG: hypothetical protein AMXMBFR53_03490 [Gemmatimonadota bacterium]